MDWFGLCVSLEFVVGRGVWRLLLLLIYDIEWLFDVIIDFC